METTASRKPDRKTLIQAALGSKDLTLHRVSEESARLYGRSSSWFIQHNFYHALKSGRFSPSLHQLCAFSRISGYQLQDWLTVFGFSIEDIPRLQIQLPSKRTVLLDRSLDTSGSSVAWFRDRQGSKPPTGVVPLGQLLERSEPKRLSTLSTTNNRKFLYAKIGNEDALAFPELLPGSIVRVGRQIPEQSSFARGRQNAQRIFLIEHSHGLWCSRLHAPLKDRIYPVANQLPFAQIELRTPAEARILGVVDLEIRRLNNFEAAEVPKELADQWRPEALGQHHDGMGDFLRQARRKAALSFRNASAISRQIAEIYGDEHYFVAPGSLSDYEATNRPPRHVQKVITLCTLYGVPFAEFITAAGVKLTELGRSPIPEAILSNPGPKTSRRSLNLVEPERQSPILTSLRNEFGDIPFFLRGSLAAISGLRKLSIHDLFWVGSERNVRHPYLRDGLLLFVNRRKKRPVRLRSLPLWQQPLYLLMMRDGKYVCGSCTLEDNLLAVNLVSEGSDRTLRLRNLHDAEVIGQVVTIVRRLP